MKFLKEKLTQFMNWVKSWFRRKPKTEPEPDIPATSTVAEPQDDPVVEDLTHVEGEIIPPEVKVDTEAPIKTPLVIEDKALGLETTNDVIGVEPVSPVEDVPEVPDAPLSVEGMYDTSLDVVMEKCVYRIYRDKSGKRFLKSEERGDVLVFDEVKNRIDPPVKNLIKAPIDDVVRVMKSLSLWLKTQRKSPAAKKLAVQIDIVNGYMLAHTSDSNNLVLRARGIYQEIRDIPSHKDATEKLLKHKCVQLKTVADLMQESCEVV